MDEDEEIVFDKNEKVEPGKQPSMTRLLDHIAYGSAEKIASTTINTTSTGTTYANNILTGITSNIPLPDLLPDVDKIDKMIQTGTYAFYGLIGFSLTGSIYFSLKTVREFGQWRQWFRYRKLLQQRNLKK